VVSWDLCIICGYEIIPLLNEEVDNPHLKSGAKNESLSMPVWLLSGPIS